MSRDRRRRRGGEDPEPLAALLGRFGARIGVDADLARLMADTPRWADVVGSDLAGAGSPVSCRDGQLVIETRDTLAETRLRYAAEAIRACVNEHLGHDVVRRVVVRRPR